MDVARLLRDRYRLGEVIGRGSAAIVYEAVDIRLGRRVAVKLYQATDAIGRFRFASEARLLAGLSHPGLVTVHDVCLDGDQPFLVLRLVDGPSLRHLLDRGPFDSATVARHGARLADALAHVHACGVVHRDIKPANILVDASGGCHLTDFGLARATAAARLTGPGEYVGTPAYLAPEQITDVEVGPAADVYALGLVLLECLTGQTEYTGTTAETALARLSRSPRVPTDLEPGWRTVLTAMTARDPARRPTASRCAETIADLARTRTTTMPIVPLPRPAATRLPRRRAVHAGVTALALVTIAMAAATTDAVTGHPVSDPGSLSEKETVPSSVPGDVPAEAPGDLPADVPAGMPADVPAPPPPAQPGQLPSERTSSGPGSGSGSSSGHGSGEGDGDRRPTEKGKDRATGSGHG